VGDLIKRILDILLTLAGVIAVLFIVIGGYSYITSRGNEKQATSGRQTLTYAIIGLAAVLLAYTLVNVLTNLFTQGKLFGQ
jgi:TRAP-type C4-dicarboxylate transport system permease small subunit